MVYMVYAPYLPLNERVCVGVWELIPKADLQDSDAMETGRQGGLVDSRTFLT
jgi:hypothetical protein